MTYIYDHKTEYKSEECGIVLCHVEEIKKIIGCNSYTSQKKEYEHCKILNSVGKLDILTKNVRNQHKYTYKTRVNAYAI